MKQLFVRIFPNFHNLKTGKERQIKYWLIILLIWTTVLGRRQLCRPTSITNSSTILINVLSNRYHFVINLHCSWLSSHDSSFHYVLLASYTILSPLLDFDPSVMPSVERSSIRKCPYYRFF